MSETYKHRKVPERGPHQFQNEILNYLMYEVGKKTLINAGLLDKTYEDWLTGLLKNRIPTLNRFGQEAFYGSWEHFEEQVQIFYDEKKKKMGIVRALKRLRKE